MRIFRKRREHPTAIVTLSESLESMPNTPPTCGACVTFGVFRVVHLSRLAGFVGTGGLTRPLVVVGVGVVVLVVLLMVVDVGILVVLGGNGGDIGGGGNILFMSSGLVPSTSNVVALSQLSKRWYFSSRLSDLWIFGIKSSQRAILEPR